MKLFDFKKAQFVKTAMKIGQYPAFKSDRGVLYPEMAVAGRSNVGKSSLLNHLFRSPGLVKTSSTPGKTQALNFFSVDDGLSICDLPGYGFAKVPMNVRKKWGPMVQAYLENREPLKLILFLLDIRRIPNDDDMRFVEWVLQSNMAMVLVLTKVDKVRANERKKNTTKILETFNLENLHYIYYSVTKNVGRKELLSLINEALVDELKKD